jgi:hypothetical protein
MIVLLGYTNSNKIRGTISKVMVGDKMIRKISDDRHRNRHQQHHRHHHHHHHQHHQHQFLLVHLVRLRLHINFRLNVSSSS